VIEITVEFATLYDGDHGVETDCPKGLRPDLAGASLDMAQHVQCFNYQHRAIRSIHDSPQQANAIVVAQPTFFAPCDVCELPGSGFRLFGDLDHATQLLHR
jgi:hypothetical protein